MKKLLIVLDCEDYILEDLKKFDINEIELYPNTDTIYSYTWEDGFRLLEMPKYEMLDEGDIYISNNRQKIGWNNCLRNIIGEE